MSDAAAAVAAVRLGLSGETRLNCVLSETAPSHWAPVSGFTTILDASTETTSPLTYVGLIAASLPCPNPATASMNIKNAMYEDFLTIAPFGFSNLTPDNTGKLPFPEYDVDFISEV